MRHGSAREVDGTLRGPSDLHLYLDHRSIRHLASLLDEIPDLAEDLSDARTRQCRLGSVDFRAKSGYREERLPFDPAAARAEDELRVVLVSWVRLVCEERAVEYPGFDTITGMALWLRRNIIALAMTEGAQGALAEIRAVVDAALAVVCPPPASAGADPELLQRARGTFLNASGIAELAKELGSEFAGLNVRRVQTLRRAGMLEPVPGPWAPSWPDLFFVGEALDAHLAHPIRKRKATG